jgi:hypothetical protein
MSCPCDLDLSNQKDITELPYDLVVKGELNISNSGIAKLPKGLVVRGAFLMKGTAIEEQNHLLRTILTKKLVRSTGFFLSGFAISILILPYYFHQSEDI